MSLLCFVFLVTVSGCWWRIQWLPLQVCNNSFIYYCFWIISANVNIVKKANNGLVLFKKYFCLMDPWKGRMTSQGPSNSLFYTTFALTYAQPIELFNEKLVKSKTHWEGQPLCSNSSPKHITCREASEVIFFLNYQKIAVAYMDTKLWPSPKHMLFLGPRMLLGPSLPLTTTYSSSSVEALPNPLKLYSHSIVLAIKGKGQDGGRERIILLGAYHISFIMQDI